MVQYSHESLINLLFQHPSPRYWRIDQFKLLLFWHALAMFSLSDIHVQIACDEVPTTRFKRDSYGINRKVLQQPKRFANKSRTTHATSSIMGPSLKACSRILSFLPPSILLSLIFLLTYLLAALLSGSSFPVYLLVRLLASLLIRLLAGLLAGLACLLALLEHQNWKNNPKKTGKHFPKKYTIKNSTKLFHRIGCKRVSTRL